jgi:hypothetical protein
LNPQLLSIPFLQGEEVPFELELIGDMIFCVSNAQNGLSRIKYNLYFETIMAAYSKYQLFYILVPVRNSSHGCISILMIHWQNIGDIRNGRRTKVPVFDLETGARSGFKELEVSEDCGVVSYQTHCRLFTVIASMDLSFILMLLCVCVCMRVCSSFCELS